MNNEETKILDNENTRIEEQKVEQAPENKKKKKGMKMSTAAAAGIGAVAGSGSAYAAERMIDNAQQEEIEEVEEVVVESQPDRNSNVEDSVNTHHTNHNEDGPQAENHDNYDGSDNPQLADDEVRVVGVAVANNGEGGVSTIGVLQNGEDTAFVVDVESDNIVDKIIHDDNANGVIEDNEIHDVRSEGYETAQVLRAYVHDSQEAGTVAVVTDLDNGNTYQLTQTDEGFGLSPLIAPVDDENVCVADNTTPDYMNDADTGMMEG